jgi:GPI-anchor transamidase subunit K
VLHTYGIGNGWRRPGEWVGREQERSKKGSAALITDFFGGVVGVDVGEEGSNGTDSPEDLLRDSRHIDQSKPRKHGDVKAATYTGSGDMPGSPWTGWKELRAWSSFLIVGLLIGGVWTRRS